GSTAKRESVTLLSSEPSGRTVKRAEPFAVRRLKTMSSPLGAQAGLTSTHDWGRQSVRRRVAPSLVSTSHSDCCAPYGPESRLNAIHEPSGDQPRPPWYCVAQIPHPASRRTRPLATSLT